MRNWQKASVVTSLVLTVVLILNTSIMAYMNYQTTFTASMAPTGAGESLEIGLKAEAGRPSPLAYYLRQARGWISSYAVGGVEKTNAETGIIVSIDGTNIAASATVDYYIEARETTGQGQPYRFLEGNSSSVTVNGADLDLSNQTSIENHLTAMGLSTSSSWTIDYYVYVKASATGAISGETLISEISYQKFDSVTYQYGQEITESLYVDRDDDDLNPHQTNSIQYSYWIYVGDDSDGWEDYEGTQLFRGCDISQGTEIESAYLKLYSPDYEVGLPLTAYIYGEDVDSADQLSTYSDYSGANRTTEYATWSISSWGSGWQQSPDIGSVVEEIIARDGWISGNNIHLFMEHTTGWGGEQEFIRYQAYDDAGNQEPELHITYIGFVSSWYQIGPVSVLSMPLGQTLGAFTVIAVSCYAVYTAIYRGEKKK